MNVYNSIQVIFVSAVHRVGAPCRNSFARCSLFLRLLSAVDHRALLESEIPLLFIFDVQFVLEILSLGISPNFRSPSKAFSPNSCLSA